MKKYHIYADCYHSFEVEASDEEMAREIAHSEMHDHYTVDEVVDCECTEVSPGVYDVYASTYNHFDIEAENEEKANELAHYEMYDHYTTSSVANIFECNEI